jgi:hypothetical protein
MDVSGRSLLQRAVSADLLARALIAERVGPGPPA